ncbi:MAG TPA: hypothetical protein VEK08_03910 [Planctomycetota bacterium]|nr:hypothetical protein [Planctomycetota bacterium]
MLPTEVSRNTCQPIPLTDGECFPVIDVPNEAAEDVEEKGTTIKFWLQGKQLLYKQAREGTGEHWSEKITSELAAEIGLPAAYVELAKWRGNYGVVTASVLQPGEELVEAKDLLARLTLSGEPNPRLHTLENNFALLDRINQPLRWNPPPEIKRTRDTFIGYLVFDAWVNNEDRHHENWGVIDIQPWAREDDFSRYFLAASFDHASSLGREQTDEQRKVLLTTNQVGDYIARCLSGIFPDETAADPLSAHAAVERAFELEPEATRFWIGRVLALSDKKIENLFNRLPQDAISPFARALALAVLQYSAERFSRLLKIGIQK